MSKYFDVSFAVALFLSGVGNGHGSWIKIACLVESPLAVEVVVVVAGDDVLPELMLICSKLFDAVAVDVIDGGSLTISLRFVATAPDTVADVDVVVGVVVATSNESLIVALTIK